MVGSQRITVGYRRNLSLGVQCHPCHYVDESSLVCWTYCYRGWRRTLWCGSWLVQLFGIGTHLVSSFQIYRIEVCRAMMRGGNIVGLKGDFLCTLTQKE